MFPAMSFLTIKDKISVLACFFISWINCALLGLLHISLRLVHCCSIRALHSCLQAGLTALFWWTDLSNVRIISKTVLVGGAVNISWTYPKSHRSEPKFFCRMLHTGVCAYKSSVKEASKTVKEGKISQHDDRVNHVFSVSMRPVSREDSGEYWCGAEAGGQSEHGYKVYITRIDVTVTGECVRARLGSFFLQTAQI